MAARRVNDFPKSSAVHFKFIILSFILIYCCVSMLLWLQLSLPSSSSSIQRYSVWLYSAPATPARFFCWKADTNQLHYLDFKDAVCYVSYIVLIDSLLVISRSKAWEPEFTAQSLIHILGLSHASVHQSACTNDKTSFTSSIFWIGCGLDLLLHRIICAALST